MSDLNIINERIDDIPLLLAQLERMGIQKLLDKYFQTHGNWKGMSLGWVTVIWMTYIMSQGDHRLSHVQSWVENRIQTLRICTGQSIRALDFSDDRLEAILRYLNRDELWKEFEKELGRNIIRVYDLARERMRLDSTTASGYCGSTENGLFQWGHSKDKRPDLTQVKIMLSTLDPLGIPVTTKVLPGNKSDDTLYIPAISQVRETLDKKGLLYIGDCKMAALSTRGFIEAEKDYYLCPIPSTQLSKQQLESYLKPVWQKTQELIKVDYTYSNGKTFIDC